MIQKDLNKWIALAVAAFLGTFIKHKPGAIITGIFMFLLLYSLTDDLFFHKTGNPD